MLDRQQTRTRDPIQERSARVRPQLTTTTPGNDVDHLISASDLAQADRQTWEDFWSDLLGEYEYLSQDQYEAA